MNKSKKIKLSTYNCAVSFMICDNLRRTVNSLYKKLNVVNKFDVDAEGVAITADIDNYFVVLDLYYLSHDSIAHELYHIVVRVTEDREINDEEAQAWLMGYLSAEMYKFLYKNKFKITL